MVKNCFMCNKDLGVTDNYTGDIDCANCGVQNSFYGDEKMDYKIGDKVVVSFLGAISEIKLDGGKIVYAINSADDSAYAYRIPAEKISKVKSELQE